MAGKSKSKARRKSLGGDRPDRPLNDKQKRFAHEYIVDLNATQAAMRAGYSPQTSHAQGHALLRHPEVQKMVSELKAALAEKTDTTAQQVVAELKLIAFSDIGNVLKVDKYGRVQVECLDDLPPEYRRCIESIKQTTTEVPGPDGEGVVEKVQLSVKLHPKVRAIELLMDHLGLKAPTKHEHKADFTWADLMAQVDA